MEYFDIDNAESPVLKRTMEKSTLNTVNSNEKEMFVSPKSGGSGSGSHSKTKDEMNNSEAKYRQLLKEVGSQEINQENFTDRMKQLDKLLEKADHIKSKNSESRVIDEAYQQVSGSKKEDLSD